MRSCSATRDPRRDNGSRSVRGRQSANPRITGGLVIHEQAKRSPAQPVGIRNTPTGSKRAVTLSLDLLTGRPRALAATYEARTLRRPTLVGYRRGGSSRRAPGCRSTRLICLVDLVDLAFAVPSPPDVFEWSRGSLGTLWGWPGFVTIQRRRRWSRLATGYWWSRRRSAASPGAAWSPP